jgi:hypothetical protein
MMMMMEVAVAVAAAAATTTCKALKRLKLSTNLIIVRQFIVVCFKTYFLS